MSWEFWVLAVAVVFAMAFGALPLILATAYFAWSALRPRAASAPQPATAAAGPSTTGDTAAHILAAYRSARSTAEIQAASGLADDMHAAETETVKAGIGRTLGPKDGPAGS